MLVILLCNRCIVLFLSCVVVFSCFFSFGILLYCSLDICVRFFIWWVCLIVIFVCFSFVLMVCVLESDVFFVFYFFFNLEYWCFLLFSFLLSIFRCFLLVLLDFFINVCCFSLSWMIWWLSWLSFFGFELICIWMLDVVLLIRLMVLFGSWWLVM